MQKVAEALLNNVLSQCRWSIHSVYVCVCMYGNACSCYPLARPPFPSLSTVQCYCPANVRVEKRETAEAETWSAHPARLGHTHTHTNGEYMLVHFNIVDAMTPYTLSLSSIWSMYTCTLNMNTHTWTVSLDWLPRIKWLLDSSSGTSFTPQHLACHEEKKSKQLAGSFASLGELNQQGMTSRKSTHSKLALHWLMEELQRRKTRLWKLNTSSYSTLSLAFKCAPLCVCVCMCHRDPPMEAALLASFTTSPSCSSSQSATYCDLLPSTSSLHLPHSHTSARIFSLPTSPFPLPTHWFCPISPVISFPSPLHLLVFYCLPCSTPLSPQLWCYSFASFLPPTAYLAFILNISCVLPFLNSPKVTSFITFISTSHNLCFFLPRFMTISLSALPMLLWNVL